MFLINMMSIGFCSLEWVINMKKILYLLLLCLIISGCSATYDIDITNQKVKENLKLIETDNTKFDKENSSGWTYRQIIESTLSPNEFAHETYTTKKIETEDSLGLEYNNNLEYLDLRNLSVLEQCYSKYNILDNDNSISLDTGTKFDCYDYYENLDEITIRLKTNHKVLNNNATKVENGTYIWEFTKNSNHQILLKISKTADNTKYRYLLYMAIIFVVLGGGIIYNKFKNK